jgi:hypothetical protein
MQESSAKAFVVGFEAGEASEQERILRLLDTLNAVGSDENFNYLTTAKLISIIKGGNK